MGQDGVLHKAVCHVTKHNAHEREHHPVGHGHQCPSKDHHNVPGVCKPELYPHKKEGVWKERAVRDQYLYLVDAPDNLPGVRISDYEIGMGKNFKL